MEMKRVPLQRDSADSIGMVQICMSVCPESLLAKNVNVEALVTAEMSTGIGWGPYIPLLTARGHRGAGAVCKSLAQACHLGGRANSVGGPMVELGTMTIMLRLSCASR